MKKILLLSLLLIVMGSSLLWAQDRNVSGTVSTDDGAGSFAGATVLVKGTAVGTITDAKGEYRLTVPSSATTLVFSAVGMCKPLRK